MAVKEATVYYKNTIVREDLEGSLIQKKLDTENFSREFEKEGKRKEQLQSNLNAMRESVGRNAREITEKVCDG
jgi:lipid A disaccharide synthetase